MDERLIERFWARVSKTDGCWLWRGPFDWDGYGLLGGSRKMGKRRSWRAHRLSWLIHHGSEAGKLLVCHRCDNPACVRPDHLFLGTERDNFRDCLRKGRYSPKGTGNAAARLTESQVRAIRAACAARGRSQEAIAAEYGVHQTAVSAIARRKTWKHID